MTAADLDLRLRCTAGVWRVEARGVDLVGEGTDLGEAVRAMLAPANDEVQALAPVAERGILMAPGMRRLARLRALLPILGALAAPTK